MRKCPRTTLLAAALPLVMLSAPAAAFIFGTCTASAVGVAFGNYTPAQATPLDANGSVTVNCGSAFVFGASPVTIALNAGASGGTFAARRMTSGVNFLTYNLYTNGSYSAVWGDGSAGTSTVSGTLNFGSQIFTATIFGRIPALQDPVPGSYIDTITVTVNY
jgi:spore coat protein U-like protein